MSEDSDALIREIEDEVRREKWLGIWKKYGLLIVGGVLTLIASVAGWQWYSQSQIEQARQAGASFHELTAKLSDKKNTAALGNLEKLSASNSSIYADLAKLRLAGEARQAGKMDDALKIYETIETRSSLAPILKSFATLQIASLKLDSGDWTQARNRLTGLADASSPWRFSARELLGLAAYKSGDLAFARTTYGQLLADRETPAAMRRRVTIAMTLVTRAELNKANEAAGNPESGPASDPKNDKSGNNDSKSAAKGGAAPKSGNDAAGRAMRNPTEQASSAHEYGVAAIITACACLALAGCAGSAPRLPKFSELNPFKEEQKRLPGKRVSVLPERSKIETASLSTAGPAALPAPVVNTNWTQPGGTANNAPGHLMLSGAQRRRAWSVRVGSGSSSVGRLTANPVVFAGRVYTLDASSRVTAVSAATGKSIWRKSLVPEKERALEGYGGGLAIDGNRLYVTTGFGRVTALDPSNGKQIWQKQLKLPVRAAPTAVGERVFVLASEGTFFSLSGADGTELWQFRGVPQTTRITSSPSPAVAGDIVAVPYPNGDVVALQAADGVPLWQENLARTRTTTSLGALSDAARPAIVGGVVFAVSHGGRFRRDAAKHRRTYMVPHNRQHTNAMGRR